MSHSSPILETVQAAYSTSPIYGTTVAAVGVTDFEVSFRVCPIKQTKKLDRPAAASKPFRWTILLTLPKKLITPRVTYLLVGLVTCIGAPINHLQHFDHLSFFTTRIWQCIWSLWSLNSMSERQLALSTMSFFLRPSSKPSCLYLTNDFKLACRWFSFRPFLTAS